LKDNDLDDEMWYDDDIEAGAQWIPQIDTALREAYTLIVIVTPEAMKSTYVTYEWSSMLGSNTPIFPLLFKGNYNDVHAKLLQEQVVDCRKGIPTSLIDSLKSRRSTPPEIDFLNWNISETVLRFRIAALITLWFYDQIKYPPNDNIRFVELVNGMLDEARDLYSLKLPELIVSRAYAFNQKQLRMSRELINGLQKFWHLFKLPYGDSSYYLDASPQNEAPRAIAFWNDHLKSRIDFFRTKHHYEEAFETLEAALAAIARGETSIEGHFILQPTEVIDWLFEKDDEYGNLLRETFQRVIERLKK
jgi:hypothetical protein